MKKTICNFLLAALFFPVSTSAKSLVITLNSGTRVYYLLSKDTPPQMVIADDGTFTLNSQGYSFSDVKCFFVSDSDFSGEGGTLDGIVSIDEKRNVLTSGKTRIYSLDGRLVSEGNSLSALKKGTYIITDGISTLKIQKQ